MIGGHTRLIVFSVLSVVATLGVVIMLFLPKPGGEESGGRADRAITPYNALVESFALFKTRDMILLSFTFFYTGEFYLYH